MIYHERLIQMFFASFVDIDSDVSENNFIGAIPDAIGNLLDAQALWVLHGPISCVYGVVQRKSPLQLHVW